MAKYLVQVDPIHLAEVNISLTKMGIIPAPLDFNFVKVDIQPNQVAAIGAVPYVVNVKPEQIRAIRITMPVDQKFSKFINLFLSNPITGPPKAVAFARSTMDSSHERIPTSVSGQMVGADVAAADGITGKGVKVAVLDTGTALDFAVQGYFGHGKSSVPGQPFMFDEVGHGCIEGEAFVYTTFCGLVRFQDLYENLKVPEVQSELGFTKIPVDPTWTIGFRKPVRVLAVHKIPFDGKLIKVKAGTSEFVTTPWHPFKIYEPRCKRYRDVRASDLIQSHRNYGLATNEQIINLPFVQTVNTDLAYLAGLFIAEGCFHHSAVNLSLHHDEGPAIETYLKQLGYHYCAWTPKKRKKSRSIEVSGLKREFIALGLRRKENTIPERLLKQPTNVLLAVLAGIIDGDGHFDPDRARCRVSTTSRQLAQQIVSLFGVLGFGGRFTKQKPSGKGKKVCYQVSAVDAGFTRMTEALIPYLKLKRPLYTEVHRTAPYLLPKSVEEIDFKGFLYDFTLDPESPYYLAGKQGMAFIHNTWCNTCIGGRPFKVLAGPARGALLKGGAPGAEVRPFKVLGGGIGVGMASWILAGLMNALHWKADIISMSLGGDEPDDYLNDPECQAITAMAQLGIICCIAAGNSGPGQMTVGGPGCSPDALTVGAVDIHGNIASFSSRGPTKAGFIKPDVVAPGVDILSTSNGYIAAMQLGDGPPQLAAISGTSMATPHAAYVTALAIEYARKKGKVLTTEHIKSAMSIYGDYASAKNNDYGWGLITYPILKAYIDQM